MARTPSHDRRQHANGHKSVSWVQHATRGPQIPDKWITPLMLGTGATALLGSLALNDPWHILAGLMAIYALYVTPWIPNDTTETK
jgi:hypothetical protein